MCRKKQVFQVAYERHFLRVVFIMLTSIAGLVNLLTVSESHAMAAQASFMLAPATFDPANPVTRSYFVIKTTKGSSLVESVRVTNTGDAVGTVKLYAVDAATSQTSGLAYLNQTDPRKEVGAWISLNSPPFLLAPQQSQIVSFRLHVPATAQNGEYVGGIAAENVQAASAVSSQQIQIAVVKRTVIAVQLELGAPLTDQITATGMSIGGSQSHQAVLVGLHNTGTTMLKPNGTLQVFDDHDRLRMDASFQLDTFLPRTAIGYSVYVQNQALDTGTYTANLVLKYGMNHILKYRASFEITRQQLAQIFTESAALQAPDLGENPLTSLTPWHVVGGILFLLVGVSGLLFWKQRARSQPGTPSSGGKAHEPPERERE